MGKTVSISSWLLATLLTVTVLLAAGSDYSKFALTNNVVGAGFKIARTGACSVTLSDGSVLITGGRGSHGSLASAEVFAAKRGSDLIATMSYPRADHACAALTDGRILVAGGTTLGGGTVNTAEVLDPATGKWATVGSMSVARSGVTAGVLPNGRVLIAGGESNGVASATLEVFDPKTNSFSHVPGGLSVPRMEHASVVLKDGRVLIVGGTDGRTALATAEIYDDATRTVVPLGKTMSIPRRGLSATVLLDGRVYIAGGNDGKQDLATAEIYDPGTTSFAAAAPMSVPRQGHLAIRVPHNNSILIVGGTNKGVALMFAELYIPWQNAYKPYVSAANGRRAPGPGASLKVAAPKETQAGGEPVMPTLTTDKDDYSPGEIALISGAGWTPNPEVTLILHRERSVPDLPPVLDDTTWAATASAEGNIETTYEVVDADVGVTFTLTATSGGGDTAQIQTYTFTDKEAAGIPSRIYLMSKPQSTGPCGSTVEAKATLEWSPSGSWVPLAGRTVTFILGTVTASSTTDGGGSAVVSLTVLGEATLLKAFFAGEDGINGSSSIRPFTVTGSCITHLTVNSASGTYGGPTTLTATLTSEGLGVNGKQIWFSLNDYKVADPATTNADGVATVSAVIPDKINAGSYPKGVVARFIGDKSYSAAEGYAQLTIDKASSTVMVWCKPDLVVYDGTAQTPCAASATGVGGLNQSLTVTYSHNTDAGTATASANFEGDANHNGSSGSASLVIDKASSTVTVTCPASVTYTGSAQTPCTATATGAGGLNQTLTVSYVNNRDYNNIVGWAAAIASFEGDANHTGSSGSNKFQILYATGVCLGGPGHTILQPVDADGTSVFKQGSTVPAKFRVCDANGNSVGAPGVVTSFRLIGILAGTVQDVDEAVDSTTPDIAFRWSGDQWIFNMSTKALARDTTYIYRIGLNDNSVIDFQFGLK